MYIMDRIVLFCLQLTTICAAPWQLPLLPLQAQQFALQQQLLELQQLQMLKGLAAANSPVGLNTVSPVILLLPNTQISTIYNVNERIKDLNEIDTKDDTNIKNKIEENDDSVTINAETEFDNTELQPKRAILLLPYRERLGIGQVISAIPFLPIEINVPDSIAWIYNGISSIISGIGQRFKPRPQVQDNNLRLLLKQQQIKQNVLPILIVPVEVDAPIVHKKLLVD